MRVAPTLCAVALAALVACGRPGVERSLPPVDLAPLVPPAGELPGWTVVEGPDEYLPGTVFEVLDGAAPVYQAYGFRRLLRVRYQLGADALACVTLDLFDMGAPLGAFGIYRSALPAAAPPRPWGAEGYRTGAVAAAWKGAVYVHAEADADRPALVDTLERGVAHACGAISGTAALPEILALLPRDHLVARSERYVARDLLGHDFLPGGVTARYRVDDRSAELFFSVLAGDRAAGDAVARLRAHLARSGVVAAQAPPIGDGGFRYADRGSLGGAVVRSGRVVAGVRGDLPTAAQERLLADLVTRLETSPAPR